MKAFVRAVGIDDAPFKFSQKSVGVFFTVMRAPNYIEGFMRTEIAVDGNDATERIVEKISSSRFCEQIDVIFLDGCTLGGFNIVDIHAVHEHTGIPVLTITRRKPDMDEIRNTLQAKFADWEERFQRMTQELHAVNAVRNPIYVGIAGTDIETAKGFITRFTVQGSVPEPLRVAHMLGSLSVFGESRRGR
jgi:endonuclease V-like protein UPF0215 family